MMLLPECICPLPPNGRLNSDLYSRGSIRGLITRYLEVNHRRNFNQLHAQLMDIDRGMDVLYRLQPKYWAFLILCKYGLTERDIAALTGRAPSVVHYHLDRAVILLTQIINTGRRK